MISSCCNDCTDPVILPKRIYNRPGLSHIGYRIGTYSDFRKALLKKLDADENFQTWTYRGSDDPGIALLECASILGDILTFYQELYANESFLRTAQWRESISDLVKLVGYRLAPGMGGHATFAALVKGNKSVVIPKDTQIKAHLDGFSQQTVFETDTETTAYPQLSKFNLYSPLVTPPNITPDTEFYISSGFQLKKGDRLMVGYAPSKADPANPDRLKSAQIIFVGEVRQSHGQQLFKIKGSLANFDPSVPFIGFKLGRSFLHLGHNAPTIASINNGTAQNSISYIRYVSYDTDAVTCPFNDEISNCVVRILDPTPLDKHDYPLDIQVNDIAIGSTLLIQGEFLADEYRQTGIKTSLVFVRTISDIKSRSMTWGSVSGSTSVVEINDDLGSPSSDSDIPTTDYDSIDIRNIQFHEVVSPMLTVNVHGIDRSGQGQQLNFYGDKNTADALNGRQLLIVGSIPDKIYTANVIAVDTSSSPYHITLDTAVDYADFTNNPDDSIYDVYGNLVCATQGKTEKETVLGNGDSRQKFQTFKIPKSPLTFLLESGKTPPQVPQLEVYVNGRLWERVVSFFDRKPNEQIYVVREDRNGDSWIQFGDGITGAQLPSGMNNITAVWRTGIGAYGPLKAGTAVQIGRRIEGIDKIQLFTDASGGSQYETGENAKQSAPGKIQSLDRIVSLEDFETETLSIPGITKVLARWDLVGCVPGVILTVLMEAGQEEDFKTVHDTISSYNNCRGSRRFPINVNQGDFQDVYLAITYGLDPAFLQEDVEKTIKEMLGVTGEEGNGIDGSNGLFGLGQRQFGQSEYSTRIKGIVQEVPGVIWVKVTKFVTIRKISDLFKIYCDTHTALPYMIKLFPNLDKTKEEVNAAGSMIKLLDSVGLQYPIFNTTVGCTSTQILRLQSTNLRLNPASAQTSEAC